MQIPPDQAARYVVARQDAARDPALAQLFAQARAGRAGAGDALAERLQIPKGVLGILDGVDPGRLLAQPEIAQLVTQLRQAQPKVTDTRPSGTTLQLKGRNPPALAATVTRVGTRVTVTLVDLPKRAFATPEERARFADATAPRTNEPEDTSKFALHPFGPDHTRAMIMGALASGPAEIQRRLGESKTAPLDVPSLDRVYDAAVHAAVTRLSREGLPKDEDESAPSTATLRTTLARAVAEEGARIISSLNFPSGAGLSDDALKKQVIAAFVVGSMKALSEDHVAHGPADAVLSAHNAAGRLAYDRTV